MRRDAQLPGVGYGEACERCLETASKRGFGCHSLQPPDFPEGTLTQSHSLIATNGKTSDLLPALLPEGNLTNHLRVYILLLPATSLPRISPGNDPSFFVLQEMALLLCSLLRVHGHEQSTEGDA